jgi:hypothetical protein|nr:MAG TPA: programmed cell death activator [Caudoviricetes sp.]
MTATNKTENFQLPQWVGEDHPTFSEDFNGAFAKIDATMFQNLNTATAANTKADAVEAQIGTKTRMTCDDFDNMYITKLNKEG